MNIAKRPLTVSIISWFLIVIAGVTILLTPTSLNIPATQEIMRSSGAAPIEVLVTTLLGTIAIIVSAALMLRGAKLGRQLFFVATPIAILAAMYIYSVAFLILYIAGFLMYLVIMFLLTRSGPSRFFSGPREVTPGPRDPPRT